MKNMVQNPASQKGRGNSIAIGFFLMTEKGLKVLEAIVGRFGSEHIAWVVGAKDPGLVDDCFDDIASLCRKNHIEFYCKGEEIKRPAEYTIAVSWRWLIPNIDHLIVLHDSLLPKYRGFAPLPTALINRESTIGVTALLASTEYDRGPILYQNRINLTYPLKIRDAIRLVSLAYVSLVIELMTQLINGKPFVGSEQDEEQATYSLWRDEDDYRISWNNEAPYISRFIDSLGYPYRGASSMMDGVKVRITESEVEPDVRIENRQPGKIIFSRGGCPVVVCGSGLLKITGLHGRPVKTEPVTIL